MEKEAPSQPDSMSLHCGGGTANTPTTTGISTRKQQKHTPVDNLTREELKTRLLQLEAHNKQLQNLLAKSQGASNVSNTGGAEKKAKNARPFDFTKHSKRHVLLKFAYLGWDYQGFAVQEETQHTIEAQLFSALLKTRLVQSRETSNYHRCGRTDKGVSAFGQVISITLRSKLRSGIGVVVPEHGQTSTSEEDGLEINYVRLLNKVLPPEIRMLAWCPVSAGYSARFDCSQRTYKYFFPQGNLNIELMNKAAQFLVGYHDYRNLCKMDVGNGVVNFCRRILSIEIVPVCCDVREKNISVNSECSIDRKVINVSDYKEKTNQPLNNENDKQQEKPKCVDHNDLKDTRLSCEKPEFTSQCKRGRMMQESLPEHGAIQCEKNHSNTDGYGMCVATIEGQAFLWHQIRAIMAVLVLVGEGKEEPEVVTELLNVEKYPRKPQYCLASDVPLNLYGTSFDGVDWLWDDQDLHSVITQLQALWMQHSVKATMVRRMLWDLETKYIETIQTREASSSELEKAVVTTALPRDQNATLLPGAKTKIYRPLLSRPTCESLETRVEHYIKRQRVDPDILHKLPSSLSHQQVQHSENCPQNQE